jgi:DNA-binding response OmpR family regulator
VKKLLLVDDDNSMRNLIRMRLSDTYQIVDTEDPEQALGMALKNKPDAILLDLMMPKFSGFDLCQSFRALTYTSYVPIFVITGQAGNKCKEFCAALGAAGYFEKPIDFKRLKERLAEELNAERPERRSEVRVRMKVPLRLKGVDVDGNAFEELGETEDVSASGFLCTCTRKLVVGSLIEVFLTGSKPRLAGKARVVRKDVPPGPWQRYGFHFEEKPAEWLLQA